MVHKTAAFALYVLSVVTLLTASSACNVVKVDCGVGDGCTGPDVSNPRFEVVGHEDMSQSPTLWITSGKELAARWDAYTLFLHLGDDLCDFENLTGSTSDCQVCDLCADFNTFEDRCPRLQFLGGNDLGPRVIAFDGFMPPQRFVTNTHPGSGCFSPLFGSPGPFRFIPTGNATYQMLSTVHSTSPDTILAEKKVFVIEAGVAQATQYRLEHLLTDVASNPPTPFFKWTVQNGSTWEDRFTPDLRVTRIRILTGRPGTDPLTGRFKLEDPTPVRPSRVVFFNNFVASDPPSPGDIYANPEEASQRCYVNPNTPDGDINLTNCRAAAGNSNGVLYDATPNTLKTSLTVPLTWIVEFKQAEGADFNPLTPVSDPVPAGASLAIEFTIEKVP